MPGKGDRVPREDPGSEALQDATPVDCDCPVSPIFGSSLFRNLNDAAVTAIIAAARKTRFAPKELFCRQEEIASGLFTVTSGLAKIGRTTSSGREILLDWMGSGATFGFGALLHRPITDLWSVIAVEESEGLEWDRATVSDIVIRFPSFFNNAVQIALEWSRELQVRIEQLSAGSAESRLAQILIHLQGRFAEFSRSEIPASDEELGQMAAINSFTVNKLLNRWQKAGYIQKMRRRVMVLDSSGLQRIALEDL